jgi:hypothetical protein
MTEMLATALGMDAALGRTKQMTLVLGWEAGLAGVKAIIIIFLVCAGMVGAMPLAQAMAEVRGKGDGH